MTPTMVLPGFTGSTLSTANGLVFSASRAAVRFPVEELQKRTPEEWVPLLSTEHRAGVTSPARTSLTPGIEIRGSREIRMAYDRFQRAGCTMWPYDWRLDPRHLAEQLIARVRSEGQPCNIVGHSYGCLVIATAAATLGAELDALFRKVVLIAPPLAGTMEAAWPLLFGPRDLYAKYRGSLRLACLTWPSLYAMLPNRDWNAVVDPAGTALGYDMQLLQPNGWPGDVCPDAALLSDMLTRAAQIHDGLKRGVTAVKATRRLLAVFGTSHGSDSTIVRKGDVLVEVSKSVRGDGLVPLGITRDDWHGGILKSVSTTIQGQRHAFMCEDDLVLARTLAFVAGA